MTSDSPDNSHRDTLPELPPLPPVPSLLPPSPLPQVPQADAFPLDTGHAGEPDFGVLPDAVAEPGLEDAFPVEDTIVPVSAELPDSISPFARFWRRFGGSSFIISIGVHAILLIILILWVIDPVFTPQKLPGEFDTGAGGGNGGDRVTMTQQRLNPKKSQHQVRSPMRIHAKTSQSISLPDTPSFSASVVAGGGISGGASKGFGGGAGGGIGGDIGVGRGGGRHNVPLFGIDTYNINTLEGTLYDTKRSRTGAALYNGGVHGERMDQMRKAYQGFIKGGLNKTYFDSHYISAKEKLYASNIFIPPIAAGAATKAFNCEKEISAPGWLGYYEGWITPPETGTFRFAGMGDDGMLVAINHSVKFWGPWTQSGMQTWVKPLKDWEPQSAFTPAGRLPMLGGSGRYYGSWFPMSKGNAYFIQIVIAESAGGLFSAELMIQQKSKVPDKLPANNVPLPVFKLMPLTPEELALKKGSKMYWLEEGPSFGLGVNGLKARPTGKSGRL